MKSIFYIVLLFLATAFHGLADEVFKWSFEKEGNKLKASVQIPPHHYLYSDQTIIIVNSGEVKLKPQVTPDSIKYDDEFSGETMIFSSGKAEWVFSIAELNPPYQIKLEYAGCRATTEEHVGICFMPQEKAYIFDGESARLIVAETNDVAATPLLEMLKGFNVQNSASGYLGVSDFMKFLNSEDQDFFDGKSMLAIIILIILGGLGLNLTPCILPMIPINLAIIGADTGNRRQGMFRGLFYGIGIALAYGALGLLSVLAGARFGTLNSNPWFNFAVGVVFVLLALAMFEVIHIDFSRFSTKVSTDKMKVGSFLLPLFMGAVAALLAGACVAPVVIAVLLLSVNLYAAGNWGGLLLPFLLGAGMALPWPFAGAGLAILPKPGQWMVRVKQFFGVLILGAGLWFGWQGWSLLPLESSGSSNSTEETVKLEKALLESKRIGKPVLIDFWATWCKNCLAMERVVFADSQVKDELSRYIVVKFQAEDLRDPQTKQILDYFEAGGLPHLVILTP